MLLLLLSNLLKIPFATQPFGDALDDISLIDEFADASAADLFFADATKTAHFSFAQGLCWKGDRIACA